MSKEKKPQYYLTLETSGKQYETEGETIYDALKGIPLKWNQIKAKATLKIKYGDLTYDHLFYIKILRRILVNDITCLMWGKRLKLLLEAKGVKKKIGVLRKLK